MKDVNSGALPMDENLKVKVTPGSDYLNTGEGKAGGKTETDAPIGTIKVKPSFTVKE